jgi:hypothetical protein
MSVRTRLFRVQLTGLDNGICVGHIVDISRREVLVSSCPRRVVRLCNFFPQPVLDLGLPSELPQPICQLRNGRYRMKSRGTGHLVYSQFLTQFLVRRVSTSESEE